MQPDTILLVDDDREIRNLLSTYLEHAGFVVTTAANAAEMFQRLASTVPSIVIVDVMMPGQDGIAALQQIRATPSLARLPVLLLTALDDPLERSRGLEIGADDYLGKPFLPRELLARVKSVLRRSGEFLQPVGESAPSIAANAIQRRCRYFARFTLDLDRQQLFDQSGAEVLLTGAEYRLLLAFSDRPQRVLSREALLELTHNDSGEAYDRSIDVLVSRLRSKLGDVARKPSLFRTVRGGGYMFLEPVATKQSAELTPALPSHPSVAATPHAASSP